ncbi:MAG: two-partner secretion domain-containing protein, partial [Planctomycetota bacterium]
MKLLKRLRKNDCFRRTLIYFLTCCMIFFNIPLSVARAAPAMPEVQMGTIDAVGNTHVLGAESHLYTSDGTVIQWEGGFDIGAGESVQFHQYMDGMPSADSAVLNRILTGSQTLIDGMLQGNGRVFVVNPAGIIFGGGASVNVAQLVASTLNISNTDFQAGHYEFSAVGDSLSEVINNGTITTSEGAALIAKRVLNNGTIVSGAGGFVAMAAGDRVLLGEPGSNIIVEMDSVADGTGVVTNEGTVDAPAGEVVLAAGDIYSAAMNVSGGTGTVEQNGEIHVDAVTDNAGSVTLTGADEVALGADSLTTANADTVGDGGEIVAYSPSLAFFEPGALVEAKGGSESGNGGFFELSGKEYVQTSGHIDLSASNGYDGEFLLDPLNLIIVAGSGSNNLMEDPTGTWEPIGTPSTLGIETLEEYLGVSDVTLSTIDTLGDGNPENGDIIFAADKYLGNPADNSLFVEAAGDIIFEAGNGITFEGDGGVELFTGPEGSVTSVDRGKTPNIWTRKGDIIIQAGSGGINMGSLQTGVESTTEEETRPGEIRLTTTDEGDITLQHLDVEGKRYGSVYVDSAGDIVINGSESLEGAVNVSTNTSSLGFIGFSFVCLIADGDITINGDVTADAHGTLVSVAKVWIGAGTHHVDPENGYEGTVTVNGQILAASTASGAIHSDATVRVYGSHVVLDSGGGRDAVVASAQSKVKVKLSDIDTDDPDYVNPYIDLVESPEAVYALIDEETGRFLRDDEGNPIFVENPDQTDNNFNLYTGDRALIVIDTSQDSECINCANKIRLLLPVAIKDLYEASKNLLVVISVLEDNGFGPDLNGLGGALTNGTILLTDTTSVNGGTLTLIEGDTKVQYTPPTDPPDNWADNFDENGEYTDSFTYFAVDFQGNVSEETAEVSITLINQVPVAQPDSYDSGHNVVLDLTDGDPADIITGVVPELNGDYDP